MEQVKRQRRNRFAPGPGVVKRSVSFPPELLDALHAVAAEQGHHNVSRIVVIAVKDYLNRQFDRRAA